MAAPQPVVQRAERVVILACGPSVRHLDLCRLRATLDDGVEVIAVNRAILWAGHASSCWFSLDPDCRVMPILEYRLPGVNYYLAIPPDFGTPNARIRGHRCRELPAWVHPLRRVRGNGPKGARLGLWEKPDGISTGNSAWGALGLAYHMHPKRVALLGVDGTRRGYAYLEGSPRHGFEYLPTLFESAIPLLDERGIGVVNGSPDSQVRAFRRMTPEEALAWVAG